MIVAVFAATNTIGAIPALIAVMIKSVSNPGVLPQISSNSDYMSMLGIGQNMGFVLMLFPFIAGLAAYALLVMPLHGRTFMQTVTGARRFRWKHFFISGAVWMMLMGISLYVFMLISPGDFTLNNTGPSLIVLVIVSFALIPFQAAFEEVIFRGYLMQGFTAVLPVRLFALMATAALFAAMHSFNPEVKEYGFFAVMPQYLTFGLIFGIATIFDNGIESALGAHAANNIFLCIMLTSKSSALQTPALFEQHNYNACSELAGMVISGIIFIGILWKIFGWKTRWQRR